MLRRAQALVWLDQGESDAQAAHAALMKPPGHRSNILLPGVTRIGIGIMANATGDLWVTQMFARP